MQQKQEQKIKQIKALIRRLEEAQAEFEKEFGKAKAQFDAAYGKLQRIIDAAKAEKIKKELKNG